MQKNKFIKAILTSSLLLTSQLTHAIFICCTAVNGPFETSIDGSVELVANGQIVGAIGIVVDNTNPALAGGTGGIVIIDPSNIHGVQAVVTQQVGILIANGPGILPNATVNVGAASGITMTGAIPSTAILINNPGATINNFGTIQNESTPALPSDQLAVISINPTASNTTINNNLDATILMPNNAAFDLSTINDNSAGGTTIVNAGNILYEGDSGLAAIAINLVSGSFNSITNLAGGIISNQFALGPAIAIISNPTGGGNIINEAGGIIDINEGNLANTSNAIIINAPMNNIENAGIISSTVGATIFINNNIHAIVNTGTIESSTNTAIVLGPFTITQGLTNTGYITALGGPRTAIDFSLGSAILIQQGGVITGNVLLANNGPKQQVINVSGGKIAGNVFGPNNGVANIFNFTGGTVTGTVQLNGVGDIVNLSQNAYVDQIIANVAIDETYHISGGLFNLIRGSSTNNAMDITTSVTFGTQSTLTEPSSNGVVENVNFIEIKNPGTVLTANAEILGINDQFVIDPLTTLAANNLLQFGLNANGLLNHGTIIASGYTVVDLSRGGANNVWLNNDGVTLLKPTTTMTVLGDNTQDVFHDAPGSELIVQIAGPLGGPAISGQLIVESIFNGEVVLLEEGSFLKPEFSGFIPSNQAFNIITVNDGNTTPNFITNDATLIPVPSVVVSFDVNLLRIPNVGQVLQLVSHRNSFASLTEGPAIGVANVLDFFAQGAGPTNNVFFTLLTELDQISSQSALNSAINSLAPPFNYGLVEGSHIGLDLLFDGVTDRVWDVAWHHRDQGRRHSGKHHKGINSGDAGDVAGIWLRPMAAFVNQSERHDVSGYKVNAVGGALGLDRAFGDCTTIGVAASYVKVFVDGKSVAPKDQSIKSWMGMAYASVDFTHGIFFDAMVAGATNKYQQNRVITALNLETAAQASFNGSQWGAQADLGMALPNQPFFIAPFARLKYVSLRLDGYTEHGANDLDLTVSEQKLSEFLGGLGVRMATDVKKWNIEWVPEFMGMFGYDFNNDGEFTTASFIGGGPAFVTEGITPSHAMLDFGLALNAFVGKDSVVTLKYNLELRNKFVGNSAYLQYFYVWD